MPEITGSGQPPVTAFVAVLSAAMLTAMLTQMLVGALGPQIVTDLHLSGSAFGGLSTALFLAGAASSPIVGGMVDRWGGRRLLQLLFGSASLSWLGISLADAYVALFAAIALSGVAMAIGNPATNSLISQLVPRAGQPKVLAVKQAGAQVAGATAGLVAAVGSVVGWRAVVATAAAGGVVGLIATNRIVPANPRSSRRGTTHGGAPLSGDERRLVRRLAVYAALMGLGLSSVVAHLALFAFDRVGFSAAAAGQTIAIISVLSVGALFVWQAVAARASQSTRLLTPLAALAALGAALIALADQGGAIWLWLGIGAFGVSGLAWLLIVMLIIVQGTGQQRSGRASGWVLLALFSAMTLGPLLFGAAVDALGAYALSWSGVTLSFVGAALVAAVRWPTVLNVGSPQAT